MSPEEQFFLELYKHASTDAERQQLEVEWQRFNTAMGRRRSVSYPNSPPPLSLPEEHMVSAIVGYRAWNVPLFVDELRSVAQSSKWVPYERFEAQCDSEQCSGVNCDCGIYAFKKMDSVQEKYKQEGRTKYYVWGECWLWGRILECTLGYRAQFAYPRAFVNTGAISKRMAEVFGVELINGVAS